MEKLTISKRLARRHLGLSYASLGQPLGISESAVRQFIKRNNVRILYLDILQDEFGINRNWVETGEGEMIITTSQVNEPKPKYGNSRNESGIRLLSMIQDYVPSAMQDVVKKLNDELIDLYEYKELYLRAKADYKP